MNVTCPNCATVYRVDPAKVPEAGVRARCSICSAVFAVRREPDSTARPAGVAATATTSAAPPTSPAAAAPAAASPPPGPAAPSGGRSEPARRSAAPAAPPMAPASPSSPSAPAGGSPSRPAFTQPAMPASPSRPAAPPSPTPGAPQPAAPPPAFARPAAAAAPPAPPAPPAATTPPAPPAPSSAPRPAGGARPVNPFLSQDPALKARRLARALISDMVVYHPGKRQDGLRDGNLKELFEDEIRKSWEEYAEQVGKDVADSTPYFKEALNEILAGGRQIF